MQRISSTTEAVGVSLFSYCVSITAFWLISGSSNSQHMWEFSMASRMGHQKVSSELHLYRYERLPARVDRAFVFWTVFGMAHDIFFDKTLKSTTACIGTAGTGRG